MKKSSKVQLYFGSGCGMMKFFTCKPQSIEQLILSRIYGIRFGEKDCGLSTYKPWTEQAGGLEAFLHGAAQNLEVVLKIQDKNKKLKTYSGWCPFKGLFNDTTLMQIQSGRTVPLRVPETKFTKKHNPLSNLWIFRSFSTLGLAYGLLSQNLNILFAIQKRLDKSFILMVGSFYHQDF
jgi:hypothetical protein